MDDFKRYGRVDIGGYKCPCCAPAPSERKKHRRTTRHRMKNAIRKEIATAIVEGV